LLTLFSANLRNLVGRVVREEEGQGLAEYALILVFIALVAILALTFLGSDISKILSQIATSL
jgi:pilus assembly protein Flp/PilA